MHYIKQIFLLLFIMFLTGFSYNSDNVEINGNLKVWMPVEINFYGGPDLSQDSEHPNPFLDYKLTVSFYSPDAKIYSVPGFYNGSGVWSVRFTPDKKGVWYYETSFEEGENIAVEDYSGSYGYCNGVKGSFTIESNDSTNLGFFTKGRLVNDDIRTNVGGLITSNTFWGRDGSPFVLNSVVTVKDCTLLINGGAIVMMKPGTYIRTEGNGKVKATGPCRFISYNEDLLSSRCYYLKTLGDGKRWIKGGTDSPEDFLAHTFSPHGDVYGALDYLSSKNVNSIYALLMNVGGDGDNVYPWINKSSIQNYDITKLNEWNEIFKYAQNKGIHLQLLFNEGEYANKTLLGYDNLSVERKLYYREMIARFGYLNAITWNLCEEYNHHSLPINPDIIRLWADYIKSIDVFRHPVTVHNWDDNGWVPFYGDSRFGTISYQYRPTPDQYNAYGEKTDELRNLNNILKIPVNMDETSFCLSYDTENCESVDDSWVVNCGFSAYRRDIIYPVYFSGGNHEVLLNSTIWTENFSDYEEIWDYLWYARKVLLELKFWDMASNNDFIKGVTGYELCFTNGHDYAIYLPKGGLSTLKLGTPIVFNLRWYNPRTGEYVSSMKVSGPNDNLSLGYPPYDINNDWVIILREDI